MNIKIPFHQPYRLHHSAVFELLKKTKDLNHKAIQLLREKLGLDDSYDVFLTQSATGALEMIALALELTSEDEVIMPSFTYAATANAFARTGARIVFADIEPETLNLDPNSVKARMTVRTKAIVPIHYGGEAADIEQLSKLCEGTACVIIEDAAHGIGAEYKGKPLGTLGLMSAFSFHHTKNIHAGGSGGALILNRNHSHYTEQLYESISAIYTQGTDRFAFIEGRVPAYTWQTLGGEFEMTDYSKATLMDQLMHYEAIVERRKIIFTKYVNALKPLCEQTGLYSIAQIRKANINTNTNTNTNNGHIFWMVFNSVEERQLIQSILSKNGISAYTHYEPLHLSTAGRLYGKTGEALPVTERIADRLLRLPIYHELTEVQQDFIIEALQKGIMELNGNK